MFRCLAATLALTAPVAIFAAGPQSTGVLGSSKINQAVDEGQAEHELLDLVNRARTESGIPALTLEPCLTIAARTHAAEMASHREISHQFPGELAFNRRIAADCTLHLDQSAENVGVAEEVDEAHAGFMHSPPHRTNLMNPSYNVVGIGIVRGSAQLYVVEDFGHSLPDYSPRQAVELIAQAIARARKQAGLVPLEQRAVPRLQSDACAAARADAVHPSTTEPTGSVRYAMAFTTMQPDVLPAPALKTLRDNLRAFAVGACFARTPAYPGGIYWVVLLLY